MVGLTKIKVPLKQEELTLENIQQFLPNIMNIIEANNTKIRRAYDIYKGEHAVLAKTRPFADQKANNIIVTQHIWTMVNFKCGYIYGNPIDFAEKGTEKHIEMQEYNDFLTTSDFRGIVDNVVEWVYATGVGYMFIEPKTPDIKNSAPFKLLHITSDRCAKIYSSYIDEEPLFDVIITPIEKLVNGILINDYYILSIYTQYGYYEYEYQISLSQISSKPKNITARIGFTFLPLIEFYAYKDKIGIAESCELAQNALDYIDSHSLDNIQEYVNQLLVIRNTLLGETPEEKTKNLRSAFANGILELFDTSKDMPADIKSLVVQLNNADINVLKGQIKSDMYSAWGVPLSSTVISSGNVTQGGAETANGWEHAYSVALKENNNMLRGFLQFIKISLWICKNTSGNSINSLSLKDIDVKYNIARSNNLQVKTQAFVNLIEHNVPADIAWDVCELSGDAIAIGERIMKKALEQKEKEEQEAKSLNNGNKVFPLIENIDSEVEKTQK